MLARKSEELIARMLQLASRRAESGDRRRRRSLALLARPRISVTLFLDWSSPTNNSDRESHDLTSHSQNKEVPFPLSGIPPSASFTTITASSGPPNNPLTDWLKHVHQQQLTCKPAFNFHFFVNVFLMSLLRNRLVFHLHILENS